MPVPLGGRVTRAVTDGELAESITNPSRRVAHDGGPAVRSGSLSRMPDYADVMTVREMTDLVAYLQSRYEVIEQPVAYH